MYMYNDRKAQNKILTELIAAIKILSKNLPKNPTVKEENIKIKKINKYIIIKKKRGGAWAHSNFIFCRVRIYNKKNYAKKYITTINNKIQVGVVYSLYQEKQFKFSSQYLINIVIILRVAT